LGIHRIIDGSLFLLRSGHPADFRGTTPVCAPLAHSKTVGDPDPGGIGDAISIIVGRLNQIGISLPEKPSSASVYTKEQIQIVKATCLYIATILGDYMEQLVIVGELLPSILIDQENLLDGAESHVGIWI